MMGSWGKIFIEMKALSLSVLLGLFLLVSASLTFAEQKPDPNAVFPVEPLEIITSNGKFSFTVEIADEEHERSRGLMFREEMLPSHGMIFAFGQTKPIAMWMKNTPLSLDMLFIREDGTVARVATNTVPFSEDIISSGEAVSHVLELNAGIARQIGLKSGDRIIHAFFNQQQ